MPSDTPSGGEDPRAFARELVDAAAADYARARKAIIAGVRPVDEAPSAAMAHETLRATVVAYAKALRAAGAPAERVVLEVNSAVDGPLTLDEWERRVCVESAARWAMTAYHDV